MKTFIAFACLIVAALAVGHDDISVVSRSESVREDGFDFALQQSDGQVQHQSGVLSGHGEGAALAQKGDFAWTSPEGESIAVSYIADENGYQPTGAHLPVAPAIPDHVVRLVKYLSEHGAHE
ncbi:hypothetical protein ACFFRR_008335 [Megaselia abdita]